MYRSRQASLTEQTWKALQCGAHMAMLSLDTLVSRAPEHRWFYKITRLLLPSSSPQYSRLLHWMSCGVWAALSCILIGGIIMRHAADALSLHQNVWVMCTNSCSLSNCTVIQMGAPPHQWQLGTYSKLVMDLHVCMLMLMLLLLCRPVVCALA